MILLIWGILICNSHPNAKNPRKRGKLFMKIIGLNGSPNKNGNTYFLLNEIGKIIKSEGVEFEIFNLNDALLRLNVPFCVACTSPCNQSCYNGSEFKEIADKMVAADGIIFGSPVYFGSMSGQLKCFFDKMRFYRAEKSFFRKPAAVVTVGASKYGGQETTTRAIHDSMLILGMQIINNGYTDSDCGHFGVNSQKPAENDQFAYAKLTALAKRMLLELQERF